MSPSCSSNSQSKDGSGMFFNRLRALLCLPRMQLRQIEPTKFGLILSGKLDL